MHGWCVGSPLRRWLPDLQAVGGPAQDADEEQAQVAQYSINPSLRGTHRSLSLPPAGVAGIVSGRLQGRAIALPGANAFRPAYLQPPPGWWWPVETVGFDSVRHLVSGIGLGA